MLPGVDEVLALLAVRELALAGDWDDGRRADEQDDDEQTIHNIARSCCGGINRGAVIRIVGGTRMASSVASEARSVVAGVL